MPSSLLSEYVRVRPNGCHLDFGCDTKDRLLVKNVGCSLFGVAFKGDKDSVAG